MKDHRIVTPSIGSLLGPLAGPSDLCERGKMMRMFESMLSKSEGRRRREDHSDN
jgi:hypothetical protein